MIPNYPNHQLTFNQQQPESLVWDHFELFSDFNIRYAQMLPDCEVKAVMVFVHGVKSFPEMSFELFNFLLSQGIEVWAFDLPGHAQSSRWLANSQKVYIDDFNTYVVALKKLCEISMFNKKTVPYILMGSSLGGHIVTRFAGENPDLFDGIIAEVPMFEIEQKKMFRGIIKLVTYLAIKLGKAEHYVFGQMDWRIDNNYRAENSTITSDPQRELVRTYWRLKEPNLQMGGVTFAWLYQAYRSIKKVNSKSFLNKIQQPFLIISAGKDETVDSRSHPVIAKRIKNVQLEFFADSKHGSLIERDEIRDQVLVKLMSFIENIIAKKT